MPLNIEIEVQDCETLTLEIIDAPVSPSGSIDDDAGLGDTDVTWSADKSSRELADKVDKVAGMVLSELSFTTADKNSLDQSEQDRHTHANKSVIDDLSDNAGALEYRGLPVSDQAALDTKVDKVAGYSLVDDDEIAKLLTVEQDAQKNTVNSVAGKQGFGVGVYGGDKADLTTMGLSPMDGCDDPTSDNYGNYIHTNGSIMVFIPAFCYRIGNGAAPSYSRDTVNALEIRSATEFANYEAGAVATGDMGDGWVLHRAFIDSGVQKRGFFIDKYLCSKSESDSNIAVSVKNADPLQLTSSPSDNGTSDMTNCSGLMYDALTLSVARGSNYGCMTIFMFSALGMLSMAHGQAATSTSYCAWFDSSYTTNYPKGNNRKIMDGNDTSVTFTRSLKAYFAVGKTGSASNFAKCTHNGQNCGVYGVNGDLYQVTVGFAFDSPTSVYILKESSKFNVITKDNYSSSSSYYDTFSVTEMSSTSRSWYYWNPSSAMFYSDVSGGGRALCGVYPKSSVSLSPPPKTLFGQDSFYNYSGSYTGTDRVFLVGGNFNTGAEAGVWCRYWVGITWSQDDGGCGFRATAYAG